MGRRFALQHLHPSPLLLLLRPVFDHPINLFTIGPIHSPPTRSMGTFTYLSLINSNYHCCSPPFTFASRPPYLGLTTLEEAASRALLVTVILLITCTEIVVEPFRLRQALDLLYKTSFRPHNSPDGITSPQFLPPTYLVVSPAPEKDQQHAPDHPS
jgi:hypothetical protein